MVASGTERARVLKGKSMSWIKKVLKPIIYSLGIRKKPPTLSKEEQWRARGVTIGKNFDGPDSAIDYCFGHLVTAWQFFWELPLRIKCLAVWEQFV